MLSVAIRFHSSPLAALGKYIFSPHGKLELFALFVVENEGFSTTDISNTTNLYNTQCTQGCNE